MKIQKLIFVYNEDANPVSMAINFVHRIVSPHTYDCNLCDLTYGYLTMKKDWKDYIGGLPVPSEFYLRSRFLKRYPNLEGARFPAVFSMTSAGAIENFLSADDVNAANSLDDLKALVAARLEQSLKEA